MSKFHDKWDKLMTRSEMTTFENISEFVLQSGPEDCLVKCRVTRNNKGIDRGKEFYASPIGQS